MTPEKIGRYEVSNLLGRGGFAVVYLANDPFVKRQVAIKVLPAQFIDTEAMRARFQQEAEIIATLEHPAIVPIYDYGDHQGQPFIVMRYMAGGSLAERVSKGPISIEESAKILKRIGSALDRAHDQGIIHRDLKPGNILFDQYGDAYLSDFGIARLTEASLKLTGGGAIGTPAYMSPEQVYGDRPVDGRSDIYALGVILFEMLTGTVPYEADTPAKLMMKHVLEPVPRILDVKPDLSPEYEAIMGRALAKEPADRFSNATEFTSAITLLSPTQPAKQPPISKPTPAQKTPKPKATPPPASEETVLETPTPPEVRRLAKPTQIASESAPSPSEGTKLATPVPPTPKPESAAGQRPSWFRPGLFAAGALAIIILIVAGVVISSNLRTAEPSTNDNTAQTSSTTVTEPATEPVTEPGDSDNLPVAEGALAPNDLRNFQLLARLGRGFLTSLDVNPDGNILAAGSSIGVWLYNVDTLEPITLLESHTAPVMAVAWSPDGRFLASGGQDHQIKIWDIEGREERFTLEGHHDMVTTVAWSQDARFLASGGLENVLRVWDMENGRLVQTIDAQDGPIRMVSWHPENSELVLTASEDGTARVWLFQDGSLNLTLNHNEVVEGAFWSGDSGRIFTGGDDGLIKVWDAANGELLAELIAHEFGLITVAQSPNGRLLASTGGDGFIRIWDMEAEQEVASWSGETSGPLVPAWLNDNERLALTFEDNFLGIFQIGNPSGSNVIRAHTGQIGSIAWTPEGRGLVSGHNGDDMTYLWNLETLERTSALPGFTSGDGQSISISADGSIFVRPNVGIEAFNLAGGLHPNMEPFFVGPDDSYVNVAQLSPDAEQLAAINYDGTLRIWNLSNQELIVETTGTGVDSMAWSPDGRLIATPGSDEPIIIIWDSQTGEQLNTFTYDSSANIPGLDWSPDGRFLAAVSTEGVLYVWDADSWDLSLTFNSFGTSLNSLDWSPDGRWLATGSWSGSIYVWDATGADGDDPTLYIDLAHTGPVITIAWSPESTNLATGSHDGTVGLWGNN